MRRWRVSAPEPLCFECRWNVTYGRVQQLSVPYLRSGIDLPYSTKGAPFTLRAVLTFPTCAGPSGSFLSVCTRGLRCAGQRAFSSVPAATPGLLIGPQNSLLCFDSRTGLQKWATSFDVPLVAAYPSGGGQNILAGALRSHIGTVSHTTQC